VFIARARRYLENENANFILVEDELNSFDSAIDPEYGDIDYSENDAFAEFTTPKTFSELENLCRANRKKTLAGFAVDYVKNKNTHLSAQYRDSARYLVQNFPCSRMTCCFSPD
jgi:hypothetical protein